MTTLVSQMARQAQHFLRTVWHALLTIALVLFPITPAHADLRVPAWYDVNAVITAPDWHYRVPITVPANTPVNSTIKVDVDFPALLSALGINGTYDANSWRIVRSTGALATTAEFTESIYAGATDALNNARGEVRFILQDTAATTITYYLYFDITANGSKPANTQTPINGNFEFGSTGTQQPLGWNAPTVTTNFNAEMRPSEFVSITSNPTSLDGVATRNTDGTPLTGQFSYLAGFRTNAFAQVNGAPGVTITKTIAVPNSAASAGNLVFRYRVEGWDSASTGNNYDTVRVDLLNTGGAVLTEMVGATAGNYATKPYSPNIGANVAAATTAGYRQYNGFDCSLNNTHTLGMTVGCRTEPWWTVSLPLAAYAGQTVTFRIRVFTETQDLSWFHFDDVEWSVVNGVLGAAEGFGVNITTPTTGTTFAANTRVSIVARVDALPTGSGTPVTANIFNGSGTLVASGVRLYDDGTHGDAVAGDGNYSNNGLTPADPTYRLPANAAASSTWLVRVFARDASTNSYGAQSGLIKITGQPTPEIQANYFNIDEQLFGTTVIAAPTFTVVKSAQLISDPLNGTTNPKNIPGAVVLYTIRVTNTGNGTNDTGTFVFADPIPANTELFVNDLSGPASGPVIFTNGVPTSTLAYSFTGLASATDSREFSTDNGVPWNNSPTPNASGYATVAVTNIRVRPTGSFAVNGGTPAFFDLRFQVRIK